MSATATKPNSTSATARLRRLRELAVQTGAAIYERAKIAAELMADRDWYEVKFKSEDGPGDEGQAADFLQAECFADLGGLISVVALVGMFKAFPEATWKEHRYNLRRLYVDWQKQTKSEEPKASREGPVPRAEFAKVIEEKTGLELQLRRKDEDFQRTVDETAKLRSQVRELELENATLRGRVEQLEAMVGRTHAA